MMEGLNFFIIIIYHMWSEDNLLELVLLPRATISDPIQVMRLNDQQLSHWPGK